MIANNAHNPAPPPEIQLEGVHKSFGRNKVLQGVDLTIRRGELVAVVGGSGSGKSVMLDLVLGLLQLTSGRVRVADHSRPGAPLVDIAGLDERELDRVRVRWSVVFQSNALYSGTVYDNLALWLREHTDLGEKGIRRTVREALDAVGFDGDDAVLEKRRDQLSGGMAKRVAVARAIAMDPAIIFYDEPTTGLDPAHAATIHGLIRQTHERTTADGVARTSVVITHDKDLLARLEPRIVMLYQGKVFFDGTYQEFARSGSEIIRPYFALMPELHARAPSA